MQATVNKKVDMYIDFQIKTWRFIKIFGGLIVGNSFF